MRNSVLFSIRVAALEEPNILWFSDDEICDSSQDNRGDFGDTGLRLKKPYINMNDMRDSLRSALRKIKAVVGNELYVKEPSKLAKALNDLFIWGSAYYDDFFMEDDDGNEPIFRERIMRYFDAAGISNDISTPGIVEVESNLYDTIPLEFLVLPKLHMDFRNIKTQEDLRRAMRVFLGGRFVINRIIPYSPTLTVTSGTDRA